MDAQFVCRKILLHFATVPIYPWLRDDVSSIKDILGIKRRLMESLSKEGPRESHKDKVVWIKRDALSSVLKCEHEQTNVLLDLLVDSSDVGNGAVCKDAAGECMYVDVHRVLLCLCVQLHLKMKTAKTASSDDVRRNGDLWPDDQNKYAFGGKGSHHQLEPSSPLKLHQRSFGGPKEVCEQRKSGSGDTVPESFDDALATIRLGDFLSRHIDTVFDIIVDDVDAKNRECLLDHEVDRLGFLLEWHREDNSHEFKPANDHKPSGTSVSSILHYILNRSGSNVSGNGFFSISSISNGLKEAFQTCTLQGEAMEEDEPSHMSVFSIDPPHVQSNIQSDAVCNGPAETGMICGAHKVTILRGMDECQNIESMRVIDCHDSVIYILAPLRWVQIISCTNSIVVVGAVGQSLRVEQSERLQVVSVSSHIVVNTCHDCILYTATNRSPLIVGDNRFVQLAPYNSGYQFLEDHMMMCGITTEMNKWNMPMLLMPDKPVFKQQPHELQEQHQLDHSMNVTLLPPEKMMPFVIPFRGSTGPLCGGSAPPLTKGGAGNDTLTGLLTQDFVDFAPCPFRLPHAYLEAWKARMKGVKNVKEAYKNTKLTDAQKQEFTSAVQSYFKEWLQSGGGMREVYDLAKVEKHHRNSQT